MELKNEWKKGGSEKYQLIGDNWDKTILTSYRTSENKKSLHLFNMYAAIDRISGDQILNDVQPETKLTAVDFISSLQDQKQLK